ncbi:MAG: peptidylprolyl isomerase [Okeania sp. SIO2C9]|uniref:peptidylprolyl isomerase n=1 Tax=Okeania sp. SIO2C9 TaxID=2607791 RepID=UPI0013C05A90|nr:peptidylprolyl isomerase [Okeania sp. SIO2C9]NEQ74080.1 peptidylprolyl isomerase [Okeania sp. SIO2C9]
MEEDLPQISSPATVLMVIDNQIVTIEVDGINAPITGGNFVDLVERNFYDGVRFHRIENQPQFSLVQAGDPFSRNPDVPLELLGSGNFIDPLTNETRFIPLEIRPLGLGQEIIYNQIVSPPLQLPNVVGAIGMARTTELNSASSQFYIPLNDLSVLDGSFAVFGNVIDGLDVIEELELGDSITAARVTQGIIPSRVSQIITDTTLLNNFINIVNRANIPLPIDFFQVLTEGDDIFPISTELSQEVFGVLGLEGNDEITGSILNDVINGNQGDDSLDGRDSSDYLRGGKGFDLLSGGPDNDILNGNLDSDTLFGGRGDDFLRGGKDSDVLTAGEGNDILIGDAGTDNLLGEAGADTFILTLIENEEDNADTIEDFNFLEGDRIGVSVQISALSFTQEGNNTVIQLEGETEEDNMILGTVNNSTAEEVRNASFFFDFATISVPDTLPFGDAALRIG